MSSETERLQRRFTGVLREHWHLLFVEGLILGLLGAVAIVLPQVATLAITILLSWLFLISGVVGLFTTWLMRWAPGFGWSLFSALLAITAGVMLLGWPASGARALTLLLIAFFILEGIATIMYAFEYRNDLPRRWELLLSSGVIDLLLALLLISGLPAVAEWALGLLLGINMLLGGAALAGMALHARNAR